MTTSADLAPSPLLHTDPYKFLAVGWLGHGSVYKTGPTARHIFEKISQFATYPAPFPLPVAGGKHQCELCQFEAPSFNGEIFVPHEGHIYVAPVGIAHYIATHYYQPPQIFLDAVEQCPDRQTMAYKKLLLVNGGRELLITLREVG